MPRTAVSIHLHGDHNDGLAEVLVDGLTVARFDMYTFLYGPTDNALIVVKNLANTTHHIEVIDTGVSATDCIPIWNWACDDVAVLGAAALDCAEGVPAVTAWGLGTLGLVLAVGGKTYFGRRRQSTT